MSFFFGFFGSENAFTGPTSTAAAPASLVPELISNREVLDAKSRPVAAAPKVAQLARPALVVNDEIEGISHAVRTAPEVKLEVTTEDTSTAPEGKSMDREEKPCPPKPSLTSEEGSSSSKQRRTHEKIIQRETRFTKRGEKIITDSVTVRYFL